MSYPAALNVVARSSVEPGAATVVFVHGSLDRGDSFRRVMRRLPELRTVSYDRRGYQASRGGGVTGLEGHVADLIAIAGEARRDAEGPVVALGHSLGGDVVIGAALADPAAFQAIGAYEPPMPWLGFRRDRGSSFAGDVAAGNVAAGNMASAGWPALADDPAEEAERFFSRMVSPEAWARLSEEGRASRRADGPAVLADMRSLRGEGAPFDVTRLTVPSVFGVGGERSALHHRRAVRWLGDNVPGATVFEIEAAQHGAHLSHPDHFAAMARLVVARSVPS
jgi:pimeloyl-ACP methyl ester carboxylesterase